MSSPNYPVLCYPLPYRVAPVFVQVVSPPLGWSPLSSFLVIWSPSGDARDPSVVFEAVNMPCPGPFHFSHSVDYIYEFCPLPDPDVGPSIFVCDVEHTSSHFGLCGRKFVLCLLGQCPGLCTICHSWKHTGVVHLSLQADGKVAFEATIITTIPKIDGVVKLPGVKMKSCENGRFVTTPLVFISPNVAFKVGNRVQQVCADRQHVEVFFYLKS